MGEKKKVVDFPKFDPDLKRLPFPPSQQDYVDAEKKSETEKAKSKTK